MKLLPLALAVAAIALPGCGDDSPQAATPSANEATALAITLYPAGRDSRRRESYALQCGPAQGTLPEPEKACENLAEEGVFDRPAPDAVCTEIFGGPQEVEVVGLLRGTTLNVRFSRRNGCEIEAFDRVVKALGLEAAATTG